MVSPARERFMLLFVTIFMIQLLIFPFALVFSNAVFMALWGRLSNAPCMSMKTPITCSPLLRWFCILLTTFSSAASVEEPGLKPYCLLIKLFSMFRSFLRCHSTNVSSTLRRFDDSEIMRYDFTSA